METTAAFASKLTAALTIPRQINDSAEITESPEIFLSLPNQIFTSHYNFCPLCQPLFKFFFSDESEKRPSTDSADSWWRANRWNQRKFLNLKDFSLLEMSKV